MTDVHLEIVDKFDRHCGDCTLCCKLLPMIAASAKVWDRHPELTEMFATGEPALREWDKPAGVPCQWQKHHKGCTQYARRPMGCRVWSCRWLANHNGAAKDLRRPDRAHYVIDLNPDFVRADDTPVEVIQVWVDANYPKAHQDPALRDYISKQNMPALVRYNERDGFLLIPPSWAGDGRWHEWDCGSATKQHGDTWPDDMRAVLATFA